MDAFPYEDRSLENDPLSHWKPVEAAHDWSDVQGVICAVNQWEGRLI